MSRIVAHILGRACLVGDRHRRADRVRRRRPVRRVHPARGDGGVLGGVAAKLGHVPLWAVLVTVIAAAIIGDRVGYEIGRHFSQRVLRLHILDQHRQRLGDAEDFLARRGGAAVFLGRGVAFFRAVMPALAGTARMPYRTFLVYNAAGGIT